MALLSIREDGNEWQNHFARGLFVLADLSVVVKEFDY